MNLLTATIVVSAVASALVVGVFFAFSVFVMRALAALPAAQVAQAMQRINATVIHPLFLGVFLGSARTRKTPGATVRQWLPPLFAKASSACSFSRARRHECTCMSRTQMARRSTG